MRDFFSGYIPTTPSLSNPVYGLLATIPARYINSIYIPQQQQQQIIYFWFQGLGFFGFGDNIFDSITNPTNDEIAFLVSRLIKDYRKSSGDNNIFDKEFFNSRITTIAYSAMSISMLNLKSKLENLTDEDWQ